MTVETTTSRAQYNTNGTTGPWTVPFRFLQNEDLQVIYTNSLGVDTTLVLDVDFSVVGAGGESGTVTTVQAYVAGGKLTILRDIEPLQESDYVDGDSFPAETLERDLDRLTMRNQQTIEVLDRAIVVPPSEAGFQLPPAAQRKGKLLGFDSVTGALALVAGATGSILDFALQLASATGSSLIGFIQAGTGAILRTVQSKLRDQLVSVKDFGAVGTANIANQAADTAAFLAALATGKNVFVPEGTYYLSQTINIGYGQRLIGAGQFKTNLICSGSGAAVYMGSSVLTSLIYNCELQDLTIYCTSRASTVNGVELQNCVYFLLRNLSIFGSGSPNSPTPADRVLYGSGVYMHDNTIIGQLDHVSTRLWASGRRYATDAGSQSRWTAAIVDQGQGEMANCMRGAIIGDATVALYSGVGVTLRDLSIQGCYTTGINVNAGDSTIIEGCYFEGNANYDIAIGTPSGAPTPIGVKVSKNCMNSEDIGVTPYGNFPYLAKVYVDRGVYTTIRDNNMSISTAIPLITLTNLSDTANISGNRLNSTAATSARISDSSTTTITADNNPEKPRFSTGVITRQLDLASGSVSYTGLGFRPTNIEFFGAVDTTMEKFWGAAGIGIGLQNRCMTSDAANNTQSSADCIRIIRSSAGNEQKAVLASFDADGFTLTWTKVGTPPANVMNINYIARR